MGKTIVPDLLIISSYLTLMAFLRKEEDCLTKESEVFRTVQLIIYYRYEEYTLRYFTNSLESILISSARLLKSEVSIYLGSKKTHRDNLQALERLQGYEESPARVLLENMRAPEISNTGVVDEKLLRDFNYSMKVNFPVSLYATEPRHISNIFSRPSPYHFNHIPPGKLDMIKRLGAMEDQIVTVVR